MIGAGSALLGPIEIGERSKIGANSVVIHDVPANSTVVGNPGHPVRVDGKKPEGPDADWVHLPDPVADAISGLANRLTELEELVAEQTGRKPDGAESAPPEAPRRPGQRRRLSASRMTVSRSDDPRSGRPRRHASCLATALGEPGRLPDPRARARDPRGELPGRTADAWAWTIEPELTPDLPRSGLRRRAPTSSLRTLPLRDAVPAVFAAGDLSERRPFFAGAHAQSPR